MGDVADPRVGTIVQDRYRVLERIASGGMGVVYRAERLQLGRTVAMKFLHPVFASEPSFLGRFEHEAKLMSRLDHPHCVSVIDFGVADGPYIVMEYVTGCTLGDILEEDEPLPPARALRIAHQVLAGLAHAHEQGIVHRDIKPANLMLATATGTGDHARILDFGLAKLRGVDQSTASTVVGTPSYMSPEQASIAPVDGRTDVYSTGLVLYELLTGSRAFYADEPFEVIRMHREVPPPTLADARGGLFSNELEAAIAKALAKSPDDRHQSPADFAEALASVPEAALAGRMTTAVIDPVRAARPVTATPAALEDTMAISAADIIEPEPIAATPRKRASRKRRFPGARLILVVGAAATTFAAWRLGWFAEAGVAFEARRSQAATFLDELRGNAGAEPGDDAPEPPATFATAEALSRAGKRDEAIRVLHDLRRRDADDPRAPFLLGSLYVDKGWHAEALAAYADTLERDPSYRKRPALIRDAIAALADPATRNKARALILRRVKGAALPALRKAARSKKRPVVAAEARRLLGELEARSKR